MSSVISQPETGVRVADAAEIATPAMVIDLPRVEANIGRMQAYADEHRLNLRPHIKTHKLRRIARMQVEAGAKGLTCAKAGEAGVMSEVTDDILVGYPVLDRHRAARVAALGKGRTIRVAVDSSMACDVLSEQAGAAGSELGLLVDINVGFDRTGIADTGRAVALAKRIDGASGVRFDGLFCFPGHVNWSVEENVAELRRIDEQLQEVIGQLKQAGLEAKVVSGGSTPTAYQSHHVSCLTEFRPGTYVYNDVNCLSGGKCEVDQCAARVLATVVSDAVEGKVVVDAGSKSLTRERHTRNADWDGHGYVVGYPEAKLVRLSEEHGEIDVSACESRPELGQRVEIVPVHICPSVNLHTHVWLRDAGGTFTQQTVDARGMVC